MNSDEQLDKRDQHKDGVGTETHSCENEGCSNLIDSTGEMRRWRFCQECFDKICEECGEMVRASDGTCPRCFPDKLTAEFIGYSGYSLSNLSKFPPMARYLLRTRDGQYPHHTTMTLEQAQHQYGEVAVRFAAPPFDVWLESKKEFEARQ